MIVPFFFLLLLLVCVVSNCLRWPNRQCEKNRGVCICCLRIRFPDVKTIYWTIVIVSKSAASNICANTYLYITVYDNLSSILCVWTRFVLYLFYRICFSLYFYTTPTSDVGRLHLIVCFDHERAFTLRLYTCRSSFVSFFFPFLLLGFDYL